MSPQADARRQPDADASARRRSSQRPACDDRGEPAVRCPTKAATRRPTSSSRRSGCASSEQCSRPPRTAGQLSAWQRDSDASRRRTIQTSPFRSRAQRRRFEQSSRAAPMTARAPAGCRNLWRRSVEPAGARHARSSSAALVSSAWADAVAYAAVICPCHADARDENIALAGGAGVSISRPRRQLQVEV
jgi:hypothetical protein